MPSQYGLPLPSAPAGMTALPNGMKNAYYIGIFPF